MNDKEEIFLEEIYKDLLGIGKELANATLKDFIPKEELKKYLSQVEELSGECQVQISSLTFSVEDDIPKEISKEIEELRKKVTATKEEISKALKVDIQPLEFSELVKFMTEIFGKEGYNKLLLLNT